MTSNSLILYPCKTYYQLDSRYVFSWSDPHDIGPVIPLFPAPQPLSPGVEKVPAFSLWRFYYRSAELRGGVTCSWVVSKPKYFDNRAINCTKLHRRAIVRPPRFRWICIVVVWTLIPHTIFTIWSNLGHFSIIDRSRWCIEEPAACRSCLWSIPCESRQWRGYRLLWSTLYIQVMQNTILSLMIPPIGLSMISKIDSSINMLEEWILLQNQNENANTRGPRHPILESAQSRHVAPVAYVEPNVTILVRPAVIVLDWVQTVFTNEMIPQRMWFLLLEGRINTKIRFDPASLTILQRLDELEELVRSNNSPLLPFNHQDTSHSPPSTLERPADWKTSYINIEAVLTWPVFNDQNLEERLDLKALLRSVNNTVSPSIMSMPPDVDLHVASKLMQKFLDNVHIFNPILEERKVREYMRSTSFNGLGWDAQSCLLVGVAIPSKGGCNRAHAISCWSMPSVLSQLPMRILRKVHQRFFGNHLSSVKQSHSSLRLKKGWASYFVGAEW